ncbi:MAG: hypothetical protein ACLPKB_16795 [Xanthobacteraceae bacterium]
MRTLTPLGEARAPRSVRVSVLTLAGPLSTKSLDQLLCSVQIDGSGFMPPTVAAIGFSLIIIVTGSGETHAANPTAMKSPSCSTGFLLPPAAPPDLGGRTDAGRAPRGPAGQSATARTMRFAILSLH